MIPLAAFALAGCLAVGAGSDRILARDLAPAFPAWSAAAPEQEVGPAPAPGVRRVFRLAELRRLAARWNTPLASEVELCFERPDSPLDAERIREAMSKQLPAATVEILEFSRFRVPEGEMEFPLSGLRSIPGGGYWAGWVRYAGNHRFFIWARVKVLVEAPRVVAAEELKPGQPIEAAQLRLEMRMEFPAAQGPGGFATSIDEAAGKTVRRAVAAGSALRSQWLEAPKEVQRGDTVRVDVREGGAVLELEGRAEASGSAGQTIPVMNPASQKRFQARVEGKGRVSVGKGIL